MNRRPIVHQFIPSLTKRDAVSFHTRAIDEMLRELGADSTIYTAHINSETEDRARHYRHHAKDPNPDLVIYQASTGSPMVDYLRGRSEPLIAELSQYDSSRVLYWLGADSGSGTRLWQAPVWLASVAARLWRLLIRISTLVNSST